jgi:NADP-dependent 3-hydroxy acid dehydrogenase YdfG
MSDADFDSHIALVTGASGGIGGAIASSLAARGAAVVLVGRNSERLNDLALTLGSTAMPVLADLTVDADLRRLVQVVEARFGRLDILVHSAGIIAHEKLTTAPVASLDLQYMSNVRAPYALTQYALELLRRPRGQIVFVNSSAGLRPNSVAGQFSMTQYAFRAMADVLRDNVNELGIRVVTVYPGRTATGRIETLTLESGRDYQPESLLQPDDVAAVVVNALALPWTAEVTDVQIRPMRKGPPLA